MQVNTDIHGRPARAAPVEGAGTLAFKIGDKVRYVAQNYLHPGPIGLVGQVVWVTPRRVVVKWPQRSRPAAYMPHNLEKL
jgi:hypothetical protein